MLPRGLVDDDAHRAFGRMRAHVDHASARSAVAHDGHRNQHLAVEIALIPADIMANTAGLAARASSVLCLQGLIRKALSYPVAYPDIGWVICQSSFRIIRHDHKQFNGLRRNQPVKTSHERDCSPACRVRPSPPRYLAASPASRLAPRTPRRGNATRIPRCGCWRDRAAVRVLLGGIAIQLQPGWKTYWRNPGDSGVPPRFDFSKSDNVEAVTVLWPAPKKFDDGAGGTSLGYKKQVVLPLRIVAKNADKPVTLRAQRQLRRLRQDSAFPSKPQPNSPLPASPAPRTASCPLRSIRCRSRPISATPIR